MRSAGGLVAVLFEVGWMGAASVSDWAESVGLNSLQIGWAVVSFVGGMDGIGGGAVCWWDEWVLVGPPPIPSKYR